MTTSLTVFRYPVWAIPFAWLSMGVFRFPLWMNRRVRFFKLMGCGLNGTFDKRPDLRQWAILATHEGDFSPGAVSLSGLYGRIVQGWASLFGCETFILMLEPVEGHGRWDGKEPFGNLQPKTGYEGPVAVLTRASIRLNRLKYFWKHVAPVAVQMVKAPGFLISVGIGEVPWVKQATFSVWTSASDMKSFAYASATHAEVIRKTRKEKWYSEDMFVRFRIISSTGSLNGKNPVRDNLYI